MLRVDQVLHQRYRVVRQLGHGGMGAVYEAIDERFGGPIALKEIVFASSSERQKELVARAFEREAMALAKAQHEAIPYVRDYFTEDDRQYLVMELIAGDDLAVMVARRHGPFPLADCLKWMDQLLDALDYLHTLEPPIIHRDIKPQNLKLTRRSRVKLLDFGIAKSMDGGANTLTGQTFVGATMDYSPVEQILRAIEPTFREYILLKHKDKAERVLAQNTDARCDLFSLGATFYHLLTAQPPADAVKRMLETWEGHADPLANPSTVNVAIPPAISALLLRAMAIDRDDRYSSALELQEALHEAVTQDKFLGDKVHIDSWRDRQLPVSSGANDEERRLMRAETVRLDAAQPGGPVGDGVTALPTEPLPSVAAQPVSVEATATSGPAPAATSDSMDWSNSEGAIKETVETPLSENRRTVEYQPSRAAPAQTVAARRPNIYWILPVTAAAGLFVITSVGGMIYLFNGYLAQSGPGIQNINTERTPAPSPSVSPTPVVSVITTPTATATPLRTPKPTPSATPAKTPASTPPPTPEPTPRATPVKTPRPTPRPRPSKTPDPNCIYNNTCG